MSHPPTAPVVVYRALITAGIVLMALRVRTPALWHTGYSGAQALALLTIPGFLFTRWARLHLGQLWSGSVTRKAEHHIVDTGPYGLVRHPIYTGLLWAGLMGALAGGTILSLAGFTLFTWGIWRKARLEEGFLALQLGAGDYARYATRVPMLVPFWQPG